jgi:hypothetical protein
MFLIRFIIGYVANNFKYLAFEREQRIRAQKKVHFDSDPSSAPQLTEPELSLDITPISVTFEFEDFKYLLTYCESYMDERNWKVLPVAFGALKEMFVILRLMSASNDDEVQTLAIRMQLNVSNLYDLLLSCLRHQIFYEPEFLDNLVSTIRVFDIGKFPKSFMADLAEMVDIAIEMLEEFSKLRPVIQKRNKRVATGKTKKKKKPAADNKTEDQSKESGAQPEANTNTEKASAEKDPKENGQAVQKEQSKEVWQI